MEGFGLKCGILLSLLCGCSLLFDSGASMDEVKDGGGSDDAGLISADAAPVPPPAKCDTNTVVSDCGAEAVCMCGLCAFRDEEANCPESDLRYAIGQMPGGPCVAAPISMDAFHHHTCIVQSDGTAWCWGWNCHGQLGDHSPGSPGQVDGCDDGYSNVPVQVQTSPNGPPLSQVVQIETGTTSTCALLETGTVWCWGGNDFGQLGSGQNVLPFSKSPIQVQTSAGEALQNVQQIGSGSSSTCAIDANRDMWCWGRNETGQLQTGNNTNRNTATKVAFGAGTWFDVDGGQDHMCASKSAASGSQTAEELRCWGRDVFGAVGNGNADNPGSPTGPICGAQDEPCFAQAQKVIKRSDATPMFANPHVVALGNNLSCAATSKGMGEQLWCWGENSKHALGDDSLPDNNTFGFSRYAATPVVLELDDSQVQGMVAGYEFVCATIDSNLHCWGGDDDGEQGNGGGSSWKSPSNDPLLTEIRDTAGGTAHVCAIREDGGVWCWGNNDSGQLGQGFFGADSLNQAPSLIDSELFCP